MTAATLEQGRDGDVLVMARCWRCEVAQPVFGDRQERAATVEHFLEVHPRGTTHRPQIAYTPRARLAS